MQVTRKTITKALPANRAPVPFVYNKSMFGEWAGNRVFVVYSYGYHFPIAAYTPSDKKWHMHAEKYSCTTSKHQGMVGYAIGPHMTLPTKKELSELINNARISNEKTPETRRDV